MTAMLSAARRTRPPLLRNGDKLTAAEFLRRYEAMPNLKKAELIEGVVYMPSPVTSEYHGDPHFALNTWMGLYAFSTPGVKGSDNATIRLVNGDNVPQPDACLRIRGGHCRTDEDGYLLGGPDLAAEIAASSASYDLHDKLQAYERNGVREYIVWRVEDLAIDWFVLRGGVFKRMKSKEGVYRSKVFPGLWLDAAALVKGDDMRVLDVLRQGLASTEHERFVAKLAKRR